MSESTIRDARYITVSDQVSLPVAQVKQSHDLALDVNDVGDDGVLAVVPVIDSLQVGDSMTLHWKGFLEGYPLVDWSQTIKFDEPVGSTPTQFVIERSNVLVIEDGYAEISYQIDPESGALKSESPVQTLQIVPPATQRLEPVQIDGHDTSQPIDPTRYPEGVRLQIPAYSGMAPEDYIVLYAVGASDAGSVVLSLRIDASHIETGAVEFLIGPDWLPANQGGEVQILYQYGRQGVAQASETLTLSVMVPLDLPPPVVEKAQAEGADGENKGYLLAFDATQGVYVNVSDSVQLEDDDGLQVHWQGHPSGGQHIALSPVNPDARKRFFVPASAVAANMGGEDKRFDVFYRFTPFNGHPQDSRPFKLRIQPLDQKLYEKIQWPRLAGASTLSLKQVAASGEDLQLDQWPFMAEGQLVTIEVKGVSVTGGPARIIVRNAQGVSSTEMAQLKVMSKVPREFLQTLKMNEYITVTPRISFDGGDHYFLLLSNDGVRLVD